MVVIPPKNVYICSVIPPKNVWDRVIIPTKNVINRYSYGKNSNRKTDKMER